MPGACSPCVNGSRASKMSFRKNSNKLPWKSFVPDLVSTAMTAPVAWYSAS